MKRRTAAPALTPALAGLVCFFLAFAGNAAEVQKNPHQIIGQLRSRIASIGQSTAKQEDYDIATRAAVEQLRAYIASGRAPKALTTKDKWGKTPLNLAAYMGYSEIVAELLTQANVAISINEPDDHGVTPWTYAIFAARQSAFACNPRIFTSPFSWSPLHLSQPYYTARNPYASVRKMLEDAGATVDMTNAKQQWQDICKNQSRETRNAVEAADDLQITAIAEGKKVLDAFLNRLQRR